MLRVIVTGGGTVAPIDDVRYIANVSSGGFSAAITEACLARGASVRHVVAPRALRPFERAARLDLDADDPAREFARLARLRDDWQSAKGRLRVEPLGRGTVEDYATTLRRTLDDEPADIIFLAMAVSDFEPVPILGKIDSGLDEVVIRARRTEKVIRQVRDWAPDAFLVGFKLLSNATEADLIRIAEAANVVNRADLTVANDLKLLQEGRHTVHLVRPGRPVETLGPGLELAHALVARVFALASRG